MAKRKTQKIVEISHDLDEEGADFVEMSVKTAEGATFTVCMEVRDHRPNELLLEVGRGDDFTAIPVYADP